MKNTTIKRLLSLFLAITIMVCVVPFSAFTLTASAVTVTSGTTGDCTWTLEGTVLTISGKGGMSNYVSKNGYEFDELPWGTEITDLYITEGVTSIGSACFYRCSKLKNVSLPKTVDSIGTSAFYFCEQLENVYIKDIASWCNIRFASSDSNPLFYAENLYLNKKLLKEISVPKGVTKINFCAFMYKNLNKITLPDSVTEIGTSAFRNCYNLSYINIPAGVTRIERSVFENCKKLTDVNIPTNVTCIEETAFANCDLLKEINISQNVNYIGEGAFAFCDSLKNINVDKNNKSYSSIDGVLYNKAKTELLVCPAGKDTDIIIPDSVTKIFVCDTNLIAAGYARGGFHDCNSLKNIIVPSSVELKMHQFWNTKSKSIILRDGFKKISQGVFRFSRTESVFIPKSVTTIEESAFTTIKDIWYAGSEKDKEKILIENYNDELLNATWHYNICDYDKHIYSSGSDTSCNKCEWIREICAHKYSNNCDTTCNYCSAKRTIKHTYSNSCDTSCNVCKATRSITHSYKTTITKATLSKNGKAVKACTVCKKVASTTTIKYAKSFKLSTTTYTYNGGTKTPSVVVKDSAGKTLKKNTDYTVTYASGRKNSGTYKVTVKMKGNYSGTKTLTFKINPAKISSYKLSATSYTYNGKAKTPSVTVKNASGTKLTKNTHYTVTYASGRKNVGTYKVVIKGKGNYTGTKTLTFKINPVKTSISKLTAGKKSITVNISKKSTQVSGYQIQYSTNKKFTSAKTKTISSYKTTKYTLKSLSAKKTYYVRVRTYKTVSGKKYYSGWSTYKYVKTK